MGFEPTRAEHIGLAVQRLNQSATSSVDKLLIDVVRSYLKHVLEPYVQSAVTVSLNLMKSGQGAGTLQKSSAATIRNKSAFNYVFGNL